MATEAPIHAVVAGGGVAGLEALLALRGLAGEAFDLTLVAPDTEFVYRKLAVDEPFRVGPARRVPLHDAAGDAGAAFLAATVDAVDPEQKTLTPSGGGPLEYDALVLAVGAAAVPAVEHAITWDDRADAETLGGLLQDIEEGYSRRLAVVIPPGPAWPLRAYELALFISREAKGVSADVEIVIVTPEPSPLAALGPRILDGVSKELELAGVATVSADAAEVEQTHVTTVVLQPSGRRIEVDRVLALPRLCGRPIAGIPADAAGFVDIDEHCRVRGLDGVWAAGDGTTFALKSGGFAAEQADVAAEDIAAAAGADVDPRPFDPGSHAELAGLPTGRFLKGWLAMPEEEGLTIHLPQTGVPTLTYLQRDFEAGWRHPSSVQPPPG